jgi:hypothetical protein
MTASLHDPRREPARVSRIRRHRRLPLLLGIAALGALAVPGAARAYWRGGFFVGVSPGFAYAPPIYYPPPVYYAPPPAYYAPPPAYYPPPPPPPDAAAPGASISSPRGPESRPVAYGFHCSAGVYQCFLPNSVPVGSGCSCAGIGAPSYGTVN